MNGCSSCGLSYIFFKTLDVRTDTNQRSSGTLATQEVAMTIRPLELTATGEA